jgi:putative ABC transport system permease protein
MNGRFIKIAIRRITRNYKSNFLIFAGLVVGLTSCLVIYTKINYELSFDNFHTQGKNTYRIVRVTSGLEYTNGGLEYRTGVHFPLPAILKKSIPELKDEVTMFYLYGQKINVPTLDSTIDKSFTLDNGIVMTEPSFFDVFDYGPSGIKWLRGEGKNVLARPFTAVITQKTAQRLFANEDPIGRDLIIFNTKFVIEGVIRDLPENSDLPFKIMLSLKTFTEKIYPGSTSDWGSLSDNYQCYVVLNKRSDVANVEKKFSEVYSMNAGTEKIEGRQFKLQALSKVHKENQFGNYNNRTVSSGLLLALSLIGAFIFLIASFNYSNFFLAETLKQKKQIALKLILGSSPLSVFIQLFTESILINLLAIIVALQFTIPIIRNLNSLIDIPNGYFPPLNWSSFLFVMGLLFSGSFLAVIFSVFNFKFKSLSSLLKRNDTVNTGHKNNFGKLSVILQFVVAQTVIIATLIIVKQIYFINHKDLGYNTENVIYARLPENPGSKLDALTGELISAPVVQKVSYSSVLPAESQQWSNFTLFINNEKKSIDAEQKSIDSSYLSLYSFTFLAGQNFTVSDTINTIIVNLEFLTELGISQPNQAINQKIEGIGKNGAYIKGVVGNFNSGSLHDKIRPCLFYNNPRAYTTVNIKLNTSVNDQTHSSKIKTGDIAMLSEKWKKIFPEQVFEYRFLSDRVADYYKSEHNALNLFLLFASITIFLCILGILGLSLSMNERRTKEIGLRKVNGAKISEVIILLNKDFIKWVTIAFVMAVPVAWFIMHKWLENFAYKTGLSWWIFVLAGVLALGIALLTVSLQSWRAAARNPIEALRYE